MVENSVKLLSLRGIKVHYGGVKALDFKNEKGSTDSVDIDEGEIVVLLGPNGAGKSTLLKTMFGLTPVSSGEMIWKGSKVEFNSKKMSELGVSYVGQDKRIFASLTVLENIEIGGLGLRNRNILKERLAEVLKTFPDLRSRLYRRAGGLSGGQQQMVAIARVLMAHPKVLLLDEPSLGLSPKILKEVLTVVQNINRDRKMAVVIVEHNIKSALKIADRAYILDKGEIVFEGSADEALTNDIFIKVFMNTK